MSAPDLVRLDILADEEQYDTVTGLLVRIVSYGWEEDSLPTGETRFRVHCDNAIVRENLLSALRAWLPGLEVEESAVPRQDWTVAWREFFTPVRAGRFLVLPPWLVASTPAEGRQPIVIEPKSAFGTGHHNTTVLCLEAITGLLDSGRLAAGQRFFDVGTGSGILGIACCLNGLSGLGSDIDPVAVDNALENVVINKVADAFRILPGSAEAGEGEAFDLVIANILAGPLRELAPALMARMKPGGCLVLSGLLDVQADAVEAAYAALGPAGAVRRLGGAGLGIRSFIRRSRDVPFLSTKG